MAAKEKSKDKKKSHKCEATVKPSKFQIAVDNDLPGAYKSGLGAIKKNERNKFDFITNPRDIDGSVDIDATTKTQFPHDNRWDYAVGYQGKAYFFEVHPMSEGEIPTMIAKKDWLAKFLETQAQNINKLKTSNTPYFWLFTNADNLIINARSTIPFKLAKNNLEWRKTEIIKYFAG